MLIDSRGHGFLIRRQDVSAFRRLSSGGHYRADKKRVLIVRHPVKHEVAMQFVYALAVQIDDVLEQHGGTTAGIVMLKGVRRNGRIRRRIAAVSWPQRFMNKLQ